jgi:hypothetical protein
LTQRYTTVGFPLFEYILKHLKDNSKGRSEPLYLDIFEWSFYYLNLSSLIILMFYKDSDNYQNNTQSFEFKVEVNT